MTAAADVAVVGGGLLGVYCAWRLARHGQSVVVLDRSIAGEGSTARSSGGLRMQFASAYEIGLSRVSRAFYEELGDRPDVDGAIRRTGYVFLAGRDQAMDLERAVRVQREQGVAVDWLEGQELRDAFPYCDLDGIVAASRTADDGFIDPWSVHQWIVGQARRSNVVIRQHRPVRRIERDGTTWVVEGHRVQQVVLATGAWTHDVGALLGLDLPVHPSPRVKVLTDLHPQLPAGMPLITDLASGAYVRSEHGHALVGAKPGSASTGYSIDTGLERLAAIVERAAVRFPSLSTQASFARSRVCTR